MMEFFSVETMSILMLAVLIIVMMFGHPIAFVFGGVGLIFGYLLRGKGVFYMFTSQAMGTMDSGILVAITMFILMANLLVKSGIAEDLFEAIRWLMGPLRGGVAIAVIIVCMILAACTGIVGAAVVSMGLAALPVMMKYGYEKGLAAGTICAGGTLGIMLPPSIMLVALADLTGLSAGKLLLGGIFPGFVLGGLYILYIAIRCGFRPELGPSLSVEERAAEPVSARLTLAVKAMLAPGVVDPDRAGEHLYRDHDGEGGLRCRSGRRFRDRCGLPPTQLEDAARSPPGYGEERGHGDVPDRGNELFHGGVSGLRRRQGHHGVHGGVRAWGNGAPFSL